MMLFNKLYDLNFLINNQYHKIIQLSLLPSLKTNHNLKITSPPKPPLQKRRGGERGGAIYRGFTPPATNIPSLKG